MIHKLKKTLLIVDDDRTFCESVKDYMSSDMLEVITAHTAPDSLNLCSMRNIDIVLLDQRLPEKEGHTLCPTILKHNDQTKIIFSTAYPSFDNAVKAVKAGAYDYLSKPFELEELRLAVSRAIRTLDLEKTEQLHRYKNDRIIEETILIGGRKGLSEVQRLIDVAATVDAPVLITGGTGTGKNVVARLIHYTGADSKAPFISINCSAIPENLIETELFGHEKGAFTGAVDARKGIFEMAEGGTLLLDEIGEMPLHLQAKLLGVLDDKKIKRLGGESIRRINVRIIAATSINMEREISLKQFREDLYYRLGVIKIEIPPLRERRQDIPELCDYIIRKISKGAEVRVSDSEVEKLMKYDWPGNVRELKNIIERAVILRSGPDIRPSELVLGKKDTPLAIGPANTRSVALGERPARLADVEKNHIGYILDQFSFNYTQTARAMGISLSTLKRKLKQYGIVKAQ